MLFVLPFLEGNALNADTDTYKPEGLLSLHRFPQDWNISTNAFKDSVKTYTEKAGRIAYLDICGSTSDCLHQWPQPVAYSWLKEIGEVTDTGWSPSFLVTEVRTNHLSLLVT